MFTQAELERANVHLHARFLSVSDQIFHELSRLERHIEAAPPRMRASVLAGAAQIASTQQWLRAQTEHLPSSPLQRFEILSSSLDAQQGALRHLSIIVEQHAPPQNTPAAPAPPVPPRTLEPSHAPAIPHNQVPSPEERMRRAQADVVALARHLHAEATAPPEHRLPSHRDHQRDSQVWSQQAHPSRVSNRVGGKSGNLRLLLATAQQQVNGAGSRSLGWMTALVAVTALGYGMLPQTNGQRDAWVKPVEAASPTTGPVAAAPSVPPVRPDVAAASDAPASVPAERAPSPPAPQSEPAGAVARPEPHVLEPPEPALLSAARSTLPPVPAPAQDAVAPSNHKHAASKVDAEAAAPTPNAGKEGFVPVVFTDRDEGAAKRAFGALQHKFPGLLAHRQGEAQPVDFGKKGIWHRLVVLPPRPRQQAMKLCDQLLTAGYDRCWVKVY